MRDWAFEFGIYCLGMKFVAVPLMFLGNREIDRGLGLLVSATSFVWFGME